MLGVMLDITLKLPCTLSSSIWNFSGILSTSILKAAEKRLRLLSCLLNSLNISLNYYSMNSIHQQKNCNNVYHGVPEGFDMTTDDEPTDFHLVA
jgi:hypothetical protein